MAIIKQKKQAESKNPKILLLYGVPKVGKTEFLSRLEDNLIVDLEEGTNMLDDIYKEDIKDMNQLKSLFGDLLKYKQENGTYMYKYLSLDVVGVLEEWCEKEAVKTYKGTAIGKSFTGKSILELPNGGGYHHLRNEVMYWINVAKQCAEGLILITHVKDKLLSSKAGEEVNVKDISLTGKLASIVCSKSDAIGYLYREPDGRLMISFETSEVLNVGSRCEHLKGQKFEADWSKIYIE